MTPEEVEFLLLSMPYRDALAWAGVPRELGELCMYILETYPSSAPDLYRRMPQLLTAVRGREGFLQRVCVVARRIAILYGFEPDAAVASVQAPLPDLHEQVTTPDSAVELVHIVGEITTRYTHDRAFPAKTLTRLRALLAYYPQVNLLLDEEQWGPGNDNEGGRDRLLSVLDEWCAVSPSSRESPS